jgi:hypothetical protein
MGNLNQSVMVMFARVNRRQDDTFHCGSCLADLQLEKKLVGLIGKTIYDVYGCSCCARLFWAPRAAQPKTMMAS